MYVPRDPPLVLNVAILLIVSIVAPNSLDVIFDVTLYYAAYIIKMSE